MSSVIEWNSSLGGLAAPLPASEKQALAQRIADITRGNPGGCFSEVRDILRLVPPEDREDVARRAVILGGAASSIRVCLSSMTIITPEELERLRTNAHAESTLSKGTKIALGVGAAVVGLFVLSKVLGR